MNDREDLIVACAIGDLAWLKRCLRDGFQPEEMNSEGANALHSAANHGRLECLRYLLEYTGVGINCSVTKTGATALHLVVSHSAGTRCLPCVKLLLEKGADANIQDHNGTTPLHKAATLGYAKCMKLLLEAKADIHCRDNEGHTALEVAKLSGHYECSRLLQALYWCSTKDRVLREKLQLEDYLAEKELHDKSVNSLRKRHQAARAFEEWLSVKQIPIGAKQDPGACELRLDSRLSNFSCDVCSESNRSSSTSNRTLMCDTKLSHHQNTSNLKSIGRPHKMYPYTNYPDKAYRSTKKPSDKRQKRPINGPTHIRKVHFRSKTHPPAGRVNKLATSVEDVYRPGHALTKDSQVVVSVPHEAKISDKTQESRPEENKVNILEKQKVTEDKIADEMADSMKVTAVTDDDSFEPSNLEAGDVDDFTFHEVGPVNDIQSVSANVSSPMIVHLLQAQTLQQVGQKHAAPVRSVSHSQINHRHNAYRGKLQRRVSLGSIPEGKAVTDYTQEMDSDQAFQEAIIQQLLLAQQEQEKETMLSSFNDTTGWSSEGSESEEGESSSDSEDDHEHWAISAYKRKGRSSRPKGAFATRSTPSLSKTQAVPLITKRPSSVGSAKVSAVKSKGLQKSSPPSLAVLNIAWQPETLARPLTPRVPKDTRPRMILSLKNGHQAIRRRVEEDSLPPAIPHNSPIHQVHDTVVEEMAKPQFLALQTSTTNSQNGGCLSPLSSKSTVLLKDNTASKVSEIKNRRRAKSATLQHNNTTVLKPTILKFGGELRPMHA